MAFSSAGAGNVSVADGANLTLETNAALAATTTLPGYPGQQQRGVFQGIDRIVAAGNTMVTTGAQASASSQITTSSQTSPALVRQQFFVSTDAGAAGSWHMAPVRTPGGGLAPLGYPALRIAGGAQGWMAEGPDAIWTSPNGLSWTLAATHGITPHEPGDSIDVALAISLLALTWSLGGDLNPCTLCKYGLILRRRMPMRQANAGDAKACRRAERNATRKRQRFGRTATAPE